jgi:hypothetical protein
LRAINFLEENDFDARAASRAPHLEIEDAERIAASAAALNIVAFSTVPASVWAVDMARKMADQADRVLETGGAIIWYDWTYDGPWNPRVPSIVPRGQQEPVSGLPAFVIANHFGSSAGAQARCIH